MRSSASTVVLVCLVAACGARTPLDDLDGYEGAGHGGGNGGGGGGGDDDGGSGARDAAPNDVARPPNPTHIGYVAAIGEAAEGAYAVARFYPQSVAPACAYLSAVGTCSVVDCYTNTDAPASSNAGNIDVDVGSSGDRAHLTYVGSSPTGTYLTATFPQSSDVHEGGALDFVGGGEAEVLPFDIPLTAPSTGVLTSLVLAGTTRVNVADDLVLAWQPIAIGDAVFSLSAPTATNMTPTLVCIYDGASGGGLVPHAELAAMKSVSAGGAVQATFLAMSRASTVVGDWTVSAIAVTETGTSAHSGEITLE
jgi:hypothetical protein